MFMFPKTTEMNRPLPKKAIFEKFSPSPTDRQRFDSEIRRLAIIHEISATTTNIAAGDGVSAFYVVLVSLRNMECDKKNIAMLSRLIDQKMLFVLEYEGNASLAVCHSGKVIQSARRPVDSWEIKLSGLNLDAAWEYVIIQIGGVRLSEGRKLDEQIAADIEREKILRQIERLEKQARSEKQPRRKWELVEEVRRLKERLVTSF